MVIKKMRFLALRKVKIRRGSADGYLQVTIPKIVESWLKKGEYVTPVVCTETGAILYLPKNASVNPEKLSEAIFSAVE